MNVAAEECGICIKQAVTGGVSGLLSESGSYSSDWKRVSDKSLLPSEGTGLAADLSFSPLMESWLMSDWVTSVSRIESVMQGHNSASGVN